MGQKVHPYGFRLGYIKTWHSSWYAKDRYADLLHEDLKMRAYIEKSMKNAAVASIACAQCQRVRLPRLRSAALSVCHST
jgi:hypothetical protein